MRISPQPRTHKPTRQERRTMNNIESRLEKIQLYREQIEILHQLIAEERRQVEHLEDAELERAQNDG